MTLFGILSMMVARVMTMMRIRDDHDSRRDFVEKGVVVGETSNK